MLLAVVLIVTSKKDGKEVASAEPETSARRGNSRRDNEVREPPPQEDLKEPAQPAEPRTGPPDVPPKEAVKPNPSADSGKPGGTSPQRPADPTPSTAGTSVPTRGRFPATASQGPLLDRGETEITQTPVDARKRMPAAVDTVAHPEANPRTPDAPAQPKENRRPPMERL